MPNLLQRQLTLYAFYTGIVLIGSIIGSAFDIPPSVFSNKRNPINVIFVKNGWAWSIIPLMTLLAMNFIHSNNDPERRRAAQNGLNRIALATVYWIFITQWFFGYSLFERVHVATGHCRVGDNVLDSPNSKHCRQNGGHWHGVDISGHCFLLIHSSLTILREFNALIFFGRRRQTEDTHSAGDGTTASKHSQLGQVETGSLLELLEAATSMFLLGLVGTWTIMLIATSLYFHSASEKFGGTVFGLAFSVALTMSGSFADS